MTTTPLPRVFIGASSEAARVSSTLHSLLRGFGACDPHVWDQGTFGLSDSFLESLVKEAEAADFAVLLATQDDAITGQDRMVPRDNVMLELGFFIGALSRERTILVADHSAGGIKLPTDMSGITHAPYTLDGTTNLRSALNDVALRITEHIEKLGPRKRQPTRPKTIKVPTTPRQPIAALAAPAHVAGAPEDHAERLRWELQVVARNAQAQGWKVKQTDTTLRLENSHRKRFTFSIVNHPRHARINLRTWAAELRANGLRVNRAVREPVEPIQAIVMG